MTTTVHVNDKLQAFKSTDFSGGEVQIKFQDLPEENPALIHVIANIFNSRDLIEFMLLVDALHERYYTKNKSYVMHITIPYLPYARQDRACNPGEAFSLRMLTNMLNVIPCDKLTVWDVHSGVAAEMLEDDVFENVPAATFVSRIDFGGNLPIVVAPDKGAVNRATECANVLGTKVFCATKERSKDNSTVTAHVDEEAYFKVAHSSSDLLIVDDICDGGRTFIELAKLLRPLTTGKIMLYVTHGIFSSGLSVFDGTLDKIFCANLWPEKEIYYWVDHEWNRVKVEKV